MKKILPDIEKSKMRKNLIFRALLGVMILMVLLVTAVPVFAQVKEAERVNLSLQLIPGYYSNELSPGQNNPTFMDVRNNGTTTITNIRFSASVPEGWVIEFNPPTLESLSPGSSFAVDVNVIPPSNARERNYNITLIAEANETRAVNTLFLNVERGISSWVWVGVGIAVLVIIGFIIIFLRSGK